MKKILFVYPHNVLMGGQGTNNRIMELLKILKELGAQVDLFAFEGFNADSSFKDFSTQNKDGLIKNLYIFDFKNQKPMGSITFSIGIAKRVISKLKRMLKRKKNKKYLQDWMSPAAKKMFDEVAEKENYDCIAVFYTYLANIFQNQNIKAKKVYFMEDSMFLQQYTWDSNNPNRCSIGTLLDEEIERLKLMDEFFCISYDEKLLYEKVTGLSMNFLPHLLPENTMKPIKPFAERRWDIFFIGFNNPYNVQGLNWFLEKVYPYLSKNLKIVLVGGATKAIKVTYANVDIIPFAPDLDEIYDNVKVSICPMFKGTGMKVKVVESMSRGLPIVCNDRGVDGFPDKNLSGCLVTNDAKEFAEYLNRLTSDKDYYDDMAKKINDYYTITFNREKYMNVIKEKMEL